MKNTLGSFQKFRFSLGTRIILWVVGVLVLILGLMTVVSIEYESKALERKLSSSAVKTADIVMSAIRYPMINGDQDVIQLQFQEFKKNLEHNEVIHLLDHKGIIRRSTDLSLIGQLSVAKNLETALQGQEYSGIEMRARSNTKIFAKTVPILNERSCYPCHGREQKVLGVLRVALDWENVERTIGQSRNMTILFSLLGVFLLIVLMSVFVFRVVISPITRLETSMRKVSSGDLDQELKVVGNDEIAELTVIFNKMTVDLKTFVSREQEFAAAEKRRAETLVKLNNDLRNEIVERKRVEDVLKNKESEISVINRQLTDIIEFLPDATFVVDHNRRVIAWNRALEEMTGVPKEKVLSLEQGGYSRPFYGHETKVLIDAFFEPDLLLDPRYVDVEKTGETLHAEVYLTKLPRSKGVYAALSATPFFDENGRLIGAIESIRDITQLKVNQKELLQSEQRARRQQEALVALNNSQIFSEAALEKGYEQIAELAGKALDASRVLIWLLAADNVTMDCVTLFDRNSGKFSREPSSRIDISPDFAHSLFTERAIDIKDIYTDERCSPGRESYFQPRGIVSMLAVPVRVSGEVVGSVSFEQTGTKRDWFSDEIAFAGAVADAVSALITSSEKAKVQVELEKTYKNLKEAQEELLQAGKMAAMGQLAAGISHELNQPLTGIKGFAQVLMLEVEDKPEVKTDLLKIIEQADRMDAIIKNVRFFSRKSDFVTREVDIHKPLEDSLMLLTEQLRLRNIEVVKNFGQNLPLIQGDPNHLQQVFVNLLTNAKDAVEATHQPGTITVATGLSPDEKFLEVSVRDTGSGIPAEIIESIFNPFFTTKSPNGGMGLGLSIVYRIIENHGGTIKVESKVGQGTLMKVSFPVEQES